jgi:hypothetical protein
MSYRSRKSELVIAVLLALAAMILPACSSSDNGAAGSGSSSSEAMYALSTEKSSLASVESLAEYDLVIQNGRVIDPATGRDQTATVGIKDGVITKIAPGANVVLPCEGACQVVDATGLVVSPGFINTHTHEGWGPSGMQFVEAGQAYVQDGITFWLGGNCGSSPQSDLPAFLNEAEQQSLYNNYATLSGHNTLRRNVGIGFNKPESPEQITQMVEILEGDLAAGSFGISYGAFYDPGGTKEAMIALAKASRAEGGMAASHIREITFDLLNILFPYNGPAFTPLFYLSQKINLIIFKDSLTEAIDTCKEADIPYIVSHLTDIAYNGSITWALDTIEQAIRWQGLPLASDVIGYDTFANDFYALTRYGMIPVGTLFTMAGVKPEQFWMAEDVYIDDLLYKAAYERLTDVSQAEYLAAMFKAGRAHAGPDSDSASVAVWCNIVDPVSTMLAIKRPFVFMGNDGAVSRNSHTGAVEVQPRSYACFSRLLGHWSRELGAISLKQALFKATIAPALWLGLDKKGRLQVGCDADITIFNPDTIIDRAKPEAGQLDLPPLGIEYVIVNGQIVVEHGALTGNTPGKVVRRTWQIPGNTRLVIALYHQRFPLLPF